MSVKNIQRFLDYRYASSRAVTGVDKILKLKQVKSQWEVIEEIIRFWASFRPTEYQSYLIDLKRLKESRKITKVGSKEFSGISKDRGTGGYLNYLVDIPLTVYQLIRRVYDADELKMDKKFFLKFAKKFPAFKVSQKKG